MQPSVSTDNDLLQELRAGPFARCAQLVLPALEKADDALFDQAQSLSNSVDQQQCLDVMRELRRQRAAVQLAFRGHLQDSYAVLLRGPALPDPDQEVSSDSLSLLDIEAQEEQFASERVGIAIERRVLPVLQRVGARLARVAGIAQLEAIDNPFGPMQLVRAFRLSIGPVEASLQIRLLLYRVFEQVLSADLVGLLRDVDQRLQQAGIPFDPASLRVLKGTAPSAPPGTAATEPDPVAGAPASGAASLGWEPPEGDAESGAAAAPGRRRDPVDAAFIALRDRFAAYLQGVPAASAGRTDGPPRPLLGTEQALAALAVLQPTPPASIVAALDDSLAALGDLLQQELLEQARKLGSAQADTGLAEPEEQALLLVGMLFDVLLAQRSYPRELREQFIRLCVPYARAALLDRRMFAHKTHPARRLLNALAEACDGNSGESPGERELLAAVADTVERLVAEFDRDILLFSRHEAAFRALLDQHQRRTQLAEKRAAETQSGRERLEDARRVAMRELATLLRGSTPPRAIAAFLRERWTHHLAITALRSGRESTRYAEAQGAGAALWQAVLECNGGARIPADLHERLQPVLASSGLIGDAADAALAPVDRELFALQAQHRAGRAVRPNAPAAPPRPVAMPAARPSPTATMPATAPPASAAPAAAPPAPSAPLPATAAASAAVTAVLARAGAASPAAPANPSVERIRELQVGNWVELLDGDGNPQPAKLSWVSPISNRLLFVNRRGLRVCVASHEELADMLDAGRLQIREADTAFERAMVQVLGRLG